MFMINVFKDLLSPSKKTEAAKDNMEELLFRRPGIDGVPIVFTSTSTALAGKDKEKVTCLLHSTIIAE